MYLGMKLEKQTITIVELWIEVLVSNDDDIWQVKYYSEDLLEGDKELNHYEKKQILHTYDAMDWLLSNCKWDFTNTSETPVKINREG